MKIKGFSLMTPIVRFDFSWNLIESITQTGSASFCSLSLLLFIFFSLSLFLSSPPHFPVKCYYWNLLPSFKLCKFFQDLFFPSPSKQPKPSLSLSWFSECFVQINFYHHYPVFLPLIHYLCVVYYHFEITFCFFALLLSLLYTR